MDEVDEDDQGDVPFLRQLLEMINLREIAIDHSDPALLSRRIPVRRLLEHLPDHRLRRLGQAGPDAFGFRPGPRPPGSPRECAPRARRYRWRPPKPCVWRAADDRPPAAP